MLHKNTFNVHAVCPLPVLQQISMAMLDIHTVCPSCIFLLFVHAAFVCCKSMLLVHDVCPCCVSLLHIHAGCLCSIFMLNAAIRNIFEIGHRLLRKLKKTLTWTCWTFCMSLLHAYAACLYCVFLLHILAGCPCCIVMLNAASNNIFEMTTDCYGSKINIYICSHPSHCASSE